MRDAPLDQLQMQLQNISTDWIFQNRDRIRIAQLARIARILEMIEELRGIHGCKDCKWARIESHVSQNRETRGVPLL